MFLGHHAVALAAKHFSPRSSLTVLLAGALLLDLLWPIFLLAGAEQVAIEPGNTAVTPLKFVSYPWSHSLLACIGWAALFGGIYFALTRYRAGTICVAFCVISHWLLDVASHGPDVPLYPGDSPHVGLGLWNSIAATMTVELALFITGLILYIRNTRARNAWGIISIAFYVVAMLLFYVANIFGPPPPSARALSWFALISWLLIPWAWSIDASRRSREPETATSPA